MVALEPRFRARLRVHQAGGVMGRYRIGDQTFRRKNFYMPCIINARFDDMTDDEKIAVYKSTYWADNITNAEWPVVLGHAEATKSNRSKLKKKMVGWLMALGRIAYLNPGLFEQARREAAELYRKQIENEHPFLGDERFFEVDGEGFVWTPGTVNQRTRLPDGRVAWLTCEVGRVVSVEVAEGVQPDDWEAS
jgi:hypothetical protein